MDESQPKELNEPDMPSRDLADLLTLERQRFYQLGDMVRVHCENIRAGYNQRENTIETLKLELHPEGEDISFIGNELDNIVLSYLTLQDVRKQYSDYEFVSKPIEEGLGLFDRFSEELKDAYRGNENVSLQLNWIARKHKNVGIYLVPRYERSAESAPEA